RPPGGGAGAAGGDAGAPPQGSRAGASGHARRDAPSGGLLPRRRSLGGGAGIGGGDAGAPPPGSRGEAAGHSIDHDRSGEDLPRPRRHRESGSPRSGNRRRQSGRGVPVGAGESRVTQRRPPPSPKGTRLLEKLKQKSSDSSRNGRERGHSCPHRRERPLP